MVLVFSEGGDVEFEVVTLPGIFGGAGIPGVPRGTGDDDDVVGFGLVVLGEAVGFAEQTFDAGAFDSIANFA